MKKNEYLNEFSNQLSSLDYQSKQDIISDFEEHFSIGLDAGKTEEQICAELGSPIENARQYLSGEKKVTYVQPNSVYSQAYQTNDSTAAAANNDKSRYTVLLVVAIALGVLISFPVGFGFICACVGLCIAAGFSGAVMMSAALAGFLVCLGLCFLFAGIIIILLNAWAIYACVKRIR